MATRSLINFSDPLFRKKSKLVIKFDERLWTLLDDMADTLRHVKGYGCAAVHVGVLRRVFVVVDKDGVIEVANPCIAQESEERQLVMEGSIAPNSPSGYVMRPLKVTVTGVSRHGKPISVSGEGFMAATFCHEIDHLDGILFADKIEA
ncbi:MAG: peptide deformylase [Defluviitaleaceae bacterium]|nr:peptide deformylase [Defluviitaleaceae bacterium]